MGVRIAGRPLRAAAWAAAALLAVGGAARAMDPFEIQVYDGSLNKPGKLGFELHLNAVASGSELRDPPELPAGGQLHAALEPSLGVLPWLELGAYLQGAHLSDGSFRAAGAKLRAKLLAPELHAGLRLGVNLELALVPAIFEAERWGMEFRPFVAWEDGRFHLAFNPIVGVSFAAGGLDHGPELEPALMALVKLGPVEAGLEFYSSLGPIGALLPLSQQQHYLFEVVQLASLDWLELQLGVGQGLTAASNPLVFKLVVGVELP